MPCSGRNKKNKTRIIDIEVVPGVLRTGAPRGSSRAVLRGGMVTWGSSSPQVLYLPVSGMTIRGATSASGTKACSPGGNGGASWATRRRAPS